MWNSYPPSKLSFKIVYFDSSCMDKDVEVLAQDKQNLTHYIPDKQNSKILLWSSFYHFGHAGLSTKQMQFFKIMNHLPDGFPQLKGLLKEQISSTIVVSFKRYFFAVSIPCSTNNPYGSHNPWAEKSVDALTGRGGSVKKRWVPRVRGAINNTQWALLLHFCDSQNFVIAECRGLWHGNRILNLWI